MKETYKDIDIEYNEDKNEWHIFIGNRHDEYERFDSLKSAKAWVDRQNKVKYIPVEVWCIGVFDKLWGDRGFKQIKQLTATRPHRKVEFWVTNGSERKTVNSEYIYLDTPENRRLFPMIAEQERISSDATKKASELIKQLEILKEMKKVE